ncbi:related to binuclear zinc cluster transcription factor that regulates the ratio between aurofusarin and rubrofusarin biosynthesis [Rhynchosporium agropyri]|uniref:Related to binuclear zinc cluster transcription factor that regulates the ratio between aurofusarin and rubrofusarin biosynthesis n=1 Tax=Rhynchosporium agropyri TaxID=914238 RepID=A0A1E1LRU2_9HELO|nr:related to binuclear zinc cluster transcription factor that regulates the ratio between aurofusarin and rubrofusarin biosynthesis [Rhynchosporium agropyri]
MLLAGQASAPQTPRPTAPKLPRAFEPQSAEQSPTERRTSGDLPRGLNARSCVTCRRRKVKCDKKDPCTNCAKASSLCVFPAPGRAPRRPRQGGKAVSEREAELLKRLRKLEGVVEELSGQVEVEAVRQSPSSDNSSLPKDGDSGDTNIGRPATLRVVGMDEGKGDRKTWLARSFRIGSGPPKTAYSVEELQNGVGRLVVDEGKSHYVSSPFWPQITDELDEIRELLDDQEFDSDDSDVPIVPSHTITEPNHQSFIMGYSSSEVNLKGLHPLPSQIPFYWQTFLENVHPLVMILHTPTMNKVIKQVQSNLNSLSRTTEALMFSIYFATVTSMTGTEVQTNFGVEKEVLLRQYRFGVEQALARAGFLNTDEIVTVQALVMFLVCVRRHDDTRFVWSLTGLTLRIAQSLGLHRDGSQFGLTPFDTEMRRRLWWQICVLDTRASEDQGSDPSIIEFSYDTKLPLSIDDDDLDPVATEPPTEREGVSEMTFCLIRYEICNLTNKLTYNPPGDVPCKVQGQMLTIEQKERLVRECADYLEVKYLQYCEDAGPLYWVAATVARLIVAKMSLMIYHPLTLPGKPSSLSEDIKDRLFISSIEIIEYSRILETEATTKKWGWLFRTYMQWHAVAFILGELCSRPNSAVVERAWRVVELAFGDWHGSAALGKNGMLWNPMRRLFAKAQRKRIENFKMAEKDVMNSGLGMSSVYLDDHPPPRANLPPGRCPTTIARDRLVSQQVDGTVRDASQDIPPTNFAPEIYMNDISTLPPQIVGMGILAPDQIQLQIQQIQQQEQAAQQTMPWLLDDNGLLDLDMTAVEGDINWDGWDDLVRDYQLEADNTQQPDMARGPALGGMAQWW